MVAVWLMLPAVSYSHDGEKSFDFQDQQKINSHLIVNFFLDNVDQGKIDIFGHVLKRSDIEQKHVAYIHSLVDDSVEVSIHLKMTIKIPVPNFEQYYVNAISVDIDEHGKINKIRTHVLPRENK